MTFDDKTADKDADADSEVEVEVENEAPFSRLQKPLSVSDIMTKCPEFSVATEEEIDQEEETDMHSVYPFEELEPYILTDNLEVDPEDEGDGDNPIPPFSSYRRKMECVTEDGKIKKLLERCGTGPVVGNHAKCVVYVHYSMYNDFEATPFDSSRLRQKKPHHFRLGYDSMIEGMVIAIQTMKKGEKSKFVIDPEYAFKKLGVPPRIPQNATILVDIELIDFTENEDIIARYAKDDDESQKPRTFEQILHSAKKLISHGNKLKNIQKDLNGAIRDYRQAIRLLVQFHYKNDQEEQLGKKELLRLYTNLCVCFTSKGSYRQACTAYNDAVHDCPGLAEGCPKLLYNSAKAVKNLGDYKEAVARLKRALVMKPDDEDILRELDIATKERGENVKKEKLLYRNMLGFSKNKTEEDDKFEEMMAKVSEDFKDLVVTQINTMIGSDQDTMKFSFGATPAEKGYCQKLCQKNNLSFRVTKTDGNETFIITNKS